MHCFCWRIERKIGFFPVPQDGPQQAQYVRNVRS